MIPQDRRFLPKSAFQNEIPSPKGQVHFRVVRRPFTAPAEVDLRGRKVILKRAPKPSLDSSQKMSVNDFMEAKTPIETATAQSSRTASSGPPTPPPECKDPLVLQRGARIQLGYRQGTVDCVRGGWKKPYDVLVRWEGEKYPQWLLFTTLELEYRKGTLKVL